MAVPIYKGLVKGAFTYQEDEQIPGYVPDAESKPLGPYPKEQEEEGHKHEEAEPEVRLPAGLLRWPHIEAVGRADLPVLWRYLDEFRLLVIRGLRVCVVHLMRHNPDHRTKRDHVCGQICDVVDLFESIKPIRILANYGRDDLRNFVSVLHNSEMEITTYIKSAPQDIYLPLK